MMIVRVQTSRQGVATKMDISGGPPHSITTLTVLGCMLGCLLYMAPVVQASPLPATQGSIPLMETPIVEIGKCRVHCMKKIPIPTVSKSKTKSRDYFQECWTMCKDLYRYQKVFQPLCRHKFCLGSLGCRVACSFRNASHQANFHSNVTWAFPAEVDTATDFIFISMKWQRPLSQPPVLSPHPIVYTLLMREMNDAWQLVNQTYEESYLMKHNEAAFVPEFLIQAIDDTGVIASSIFHVNEMIFTNVIQPVAFDALSGAGGDSEGVVEDTNNINLTHTFTYDDVDGLRAKLSWTHPRDVVSKKLVCYEVLYILEQCGVYDDLPKCPYTDDLYTDLVTVQPGEKPHFTIEQLFFNTRYTVRIQLANEPLSTGQLARVVLNTPRCADPSDDFRQCWMPLDVITASPNVTTEETSFLETTESPSLTELIRDVTITLLPRQHVQHGDGADDGQVQVNVSWTYISDISKVNFSITLFAYLDDGLQVHKAEVTGVTDYVTTLLDNTLYKVMIELIAPPEAPGLGGTVYGGHRDRNYLDDSRQVRQFNTSQLRLASRERHQAVRMNEKNLKAVNGVIIGVTCVGVLVVVAFIVLFLYKKRQSFKGIIIPKTTVAKSNSYKSSVGGKADYSNQLMVFCDEWELDPQHLKFSTPLGQGAFGKVVTGYYSDHKVAIKLVKEGAPMSYKEDLVAEINLMKRLGTHPNIVCLVGACTVTDPIALIMEYVPYGNLQNFLKKCRLEGDLQKRADGPSEIQYSMLQDCGGIENGVITPTDMLSFARQVAMAMEYLAEKKYVHRDLAARNVLLHFNKVVKVCDFGLSRDIFNDNQYKKLTNGKLPLKWMAIESLRDRVFTTQSDVWSFGILLWEIVTMGASPYPSIALADLYYVLSNHYRMDKPSNCSNELYAVMRTCWAETPLDRPSFTELKEQLEDLMAEDRDYLVLEDIDVPLSASESSSNPTVPEHFSGELSPSQAARQAVSASSSGSASSGSASTSAAGLLKQGPPAVRRPPMTIDVCIHQKSTERLMRPSESDSSP